MGPKRPYFQVIDGVQRFPNLNPDVFRESLKFRASQGDLLLSAYPTTGSKWVLYITQLILNHGEPIASYEEFVRGVRSLDHTNAREWKSPMPMRLFFTRMPLRRDTMNPEAKYVCVVRNPWDSCISYFHMLSDLSVSRFQDGTFDEFFNCFLEDSFGLQNYLDVVSEGYALKDEPNVFLAAYEELQKDAKTVVLRLAHFLGERYAGVLEGDASTLQKILELSTANNMRGLMVSTLRKGSDGSAITSKSGYQGDKSKFCIVRSARVGAWKDYMTPDHLRRLQAKITQAGDRATFMELWEEIAAEASSISGALHK